MFFDRHFAVTRPRGIRTNGTSPVQRILKILRTGVRKTKNDKQEQQIEMVDDKLEREEAQRAANYEAIKSSVKADVGDDIYAEAARPVPSQAARVEAVADGMRRTAVDEVVETKREVERARVVAGSRR
jgi:hypothetical protein